MKGGVSIFDEFGFVICFYFFTDKIGSLSQRRLCVDVTVLFLNVYIDFAAGPIEGLT